MTGLTSDHIVWAYRLLLDREPEFNDPANKARDYASTQALRYALLRSPEYAEKNAAFSPVMAVTVLASLSPYGVDGRIFVTLSDVIGLGIAQGSYEREEIAFVKSHLRSGDTFLDLGSNLGLFALVAATIVGERGRVIAFEPAEANIAAIKRSIAENPFARVIELNEVIVGERKRDDMQIAYQPLEEGSGNSGGSYIVHRSEALPVGLHRRNVSQDTLDNLIPSGQAVDFIKIDIEGAEGLAMQGATRILSEQAPVILSEVHTSQLQKISKMSWHDYFDLMRGYDYTPRLIEHGRLSNARPELVDGGVYNVVFTK